MSSVAQHGSRQQGFTLMEMLVVVSIIGILAAIALPSYRQYVMRTNRTVAKVALAELAARQESYATDHKSYAMTLDRLGYAGTDTKFAYVGTDGVISRNAAGALYRLALHDTPPNSALDASCTGLADVTTGNAARFRASAAPVVVDTDTRCGTLCISFSGERGATGDALDCWRR